jgi:hypothetical protein
VSAIGGGGIGRATGGSFFAQAPAPSAISTNIVTAPRRAALITVIGTHSLSNNPSFRGAEAPPPLDTPSS